MGYESRVSECLLLEPSVGDNPTLGRSSSRHSTLEADIINYQFLGGDNSSSSSVYSIPDSSLVASTTLSFQKVLIDKALELRVQHQDEPCVPGASVNVNNYSFILSKGIRYDFSAHSQ
ncbi:hypothetical protein Tco_0715473 [Tanacetum coccineum]